MYSLGVSILGQTLNRLGAAVAALGMLFCPVLGGCASSKATDRSATIPAGRYAEAFDAARETLRDYRFTLSRVDARAGVIMTEPRFSYGLASPFDPVHATPRDRVRDFMNQQDRRVRITFSKPGAGPVATEAATEPAAATESGLDAAPVDSIPPDGLLLDGSELPALGEDLRAEPGEVVMNVDVVIDRVHVPHWRLETSSIRQSSFAQERDLIERGMQPTYTTTRERDDLLAARLVADVRKRLELSDGGAR